MDRAAIRHSRRADGWVVVDHADLPWELHLLTAHQRDPLLVGVRLEPKVTATVDDARIDNYRWRRQIWSVIRRELGLAHGVSTGVLDLLATGRERNLMRFYDEKPEGTRSWPDSHYRNVAEVYLLAEQVGMPRRDAIAMVWAPASIPTVDRWIARAKPHIERLRVERGESDE